MLGTLESERLIPAIYIPYKPLKVRLDMISVRRTLVEHMWLKMFFSSYRLVSNR